MSGTASVSNQFTSVTSATGAQLDANFSTIVAYINDPTNRNNYAADSGTANTYAIALSPPALGYTAGLEITFKAANTNTGASSLNVNGLGGKNIFNAAGSALGAGDIMAGVPLKVVYDGTQFVTPSGISAATQVDMETATAVATFVTPGRAQFHPGVAKCWAFWSGTATGTITPLASYNVSRVVRTGTGTYSVVITNAFSSTAWASIATCYQAQTIIASQDATSCVIQTSDSAGGAANPTFVSFTAYGDQP